MGGHGKPHFLFIGADQDKPNMVSLFKNIKVEQSEWDAKGRDLPSVLISDNFEKKNSDNWQITGLSQKLYRFGPDGLTAAQYGDIKGSNAPMRSTEHTICQLLFKLLLSHLAKAQTTTLRSLPMPNFSGTVTRTRNR